MLHNFHLTPSPWGHGVRRVGTAQVLVAGVEQWTRLRHPAEPQPLFDVVTTLPLEGLARHASILPVDVSFSPTSYSDRAMTLTCSPADRAALEADETFPPGLYALAAHVRDSMPAYFKGHLKDLLLK